MTNRFKVIRAHEGDRHYNVGEIREGNANELRHLVPQVLQDLGPVAAEGKVAPQHRNKQARDPANKTRPNASET